MEIIPLRIEGACLLRNVVRQDVRGSFTEVFRESVLIGVCPDPFVQENLAVSRRAGTVRGLHFQAPPHAQDKLIRVSRGKIIDVIVDLRLGSPTYGEALSIELTADQTTQLFVPRGFAHGYCTLMDDTEVVYKMTAYYAPELEGGIAWNDPQLGIDWPVDASEAILSEKDRFLPPIHLFNTPFR